MKNALCYFSGLLGLAFTKESLITENYSKSKKMLQDISKYIVYSLRRSSVGYSES
jgi:hypothetical protein